MIKTLLGLPTYLTTPLTLIGYSVACLGAGIIFWRIFSRFTKQLSGISPGTVLATAFILGEGILAGFWVLLALGGLFRLRYIALLSVLCAICGIYFGWDIFNGFKRQISSIWKDLRKDTWGWQFIAGLTVVLCMLWVTSLGRPFNGDGSAFYIAIAKLFAYSHNLLKLPGYESFSNIGLSGEMHFSALILLTILAQLNYFLGQQLLQLALFLSH